MEKDCKKIFGNGECPEFCDDQYKQLIIASSNQNEKELVRFNRRKRARSNLILSIFAVGLIALFLILLGTVFVTDCFTIGYYDYEINDSIYIARFFKDFCLKRNPNNIDM